MVKSEEICTIQFTVTDKNVKRKQLSGWCKQMQQQLQSLISVSAGSVQPQSCCALRLHCILE